MTDRPEDKIEISAEDLEEAPQPPSPSRLEISSEDLLDLPDEPPRSFPGLPPGAYPGTPYAAPFTKAPPQARTSFSHLAQLCLAGAIGGFLGWLLTEPFFGERASDETFWGVLAKMGVFLGLICICVGGCLGAVEGIVARVWQKAVAAAAVGAGVGFAGGFVGGIVAQIVYSALGGGTGEAGQGQQMIARALGWALAGCFAGVGQGVAFRSWRKVGYGLLGGLAGGFAGGMLFDPINWLLRLQSGAVSRAIAITVVGACAGLGIGLVEEIRKQGWLLVMSGLLTGKQFILYREQTTLGSSPKCDIVLPKDPAVQPQHALIRAERERYVLQDLTGTPTVLLNGQPVTGRALRDGDTLHIGSTALAFRTAAAEKGGP